MNTKLLALAAAAVLVLSVFAPTAMAAVDASGNDGDGNTGLSVSVAQTDGSVGVTVTDGSSPAAGATVTVESTDGLYVGDGTYTADDSGTVALAAPTEEVTVEVTATYDGQTATTTATLAPDQEFENFGQEMSTFVHRLMEKMDTANGDFGKAVSEYATSNNPSNDKGEKPEHAGPPDDRGTDASGNGNGNGNGGGPPDHANGNGNGK